MNWQPIIRAPVKPPGVLPRTTFRGLWATAGMLRTGELKSFFDLLRPSPRAGYVFDLSEAAEKRPRRKKQGKRP